MDYKTFLSRLAAHTNLPQPQVNQLASCLSSAIVEACADLDTVALPGFGNFSGVKHEERVEEDTKTGGRTLFPPHIDIEFRPSVMLRKRLAQKS